MKVRRPANDNKPLTARRIVNALAAGPAITESELTLLETCLADLINELPGAAANDNAPNGGAETKP